MQCSGVSVHSRESRIQKARIYHVTLLLILIYLNPLVGILYKNPDDIYDTVYKTFTPKIHSNFT